jgi:hypothetical protein
MEAIWICKCLVDFMFSFTALSQKADMINLQNKGALLAVQWRLLLF